MAYQKNNVMETRQAILADIETLGYDAYYEDAPIEATYPFVIIELVDSIPDGANTEVLFMYLNGWSSGPDTTPLEEMMFAVNNLIDKKTYIVPGSSLSMRPELDNKISLNDPDVELKRREYRYQVRTMQARV